MSVKWAKRPPALAGSREEPLREAVSRCGSEPQREPGTGGGPADEAVPFPALETTLPSALFFSEKVCGGLKYQVPGLLVLGSQLPHTTLGTRVCVHHTCAPVRV